MAGQWEIQGKNFLITGGASGLGARYAEAYLKEGAKNVAILDVNEKVGLTTADRLNEDYPNQVKFFKCDVSKEEEITNAFQKVLDAYKQIDVIINNAGLMVDSPAVWRTACDVNWQGVVSFTMKGQKHMRKDEGGAGGTIINISSVAAIRKFPHLPIYGGSKMAVLHFSQTLAVPPHFENTGVRIMSICFGPTDTPLMQGLNKRSYDDKAGKEFEELYGDNPAQRPESAVAGCLKMFREGASGSTWLSALNKPAKDITPHLDRVFDDFGKLIFA